MNRPRRHHFVPRFYLDGFCADDARTLAVYDRVRNMYRAQHPTELAHRRDYYAYEDEQGELVFDIEVGLGQVETAAALAIRRVDGGEELTADDRLVLATYTAFQFARTPAYAAWIAAFRKNWTDEARQMLEGTIPEAPDPRVGRGAALGEMLRHAPRFAEVFLRLNWTIWRRESERSSFVTTDSPVSLVQAGQREANIYQGTGILSPDAITVLPLSQATALAMSGIGDRVGNRPLTRDQVRRVNLAVVNQAHGFVFGRDMTLIQNLVQTTGIDQRQWQPPLRVE